MIKISTKCNKRAQEISAKYDRATATCLSDVYGKWSKAKENAFDYCQRLMAEYRGWNLKILSANTFMFTAGFEFENPETGAIAIMYITPSKNEAVEWTNY